MMRSSRRLAPGRSLAALVLAVVMAASFAAPALAAWTTTETGGAAGAAATMPGGAAPTLAVSGSDVVVTWPAATFADGTPVAGYVVQRFDASSGQLATVGPACSGVLTETACTESAVAPGNWVYTDTPVQLSWTGAQSPPSAPASTGGSLAP